MSDQFQITVADAMEMLELHLTDFNKAAIFDVINKVAGSYERKGYNRAAQLERIRFDNRIDALEEKINNQLLIKLQ